MKFLAEPSKEIIENCQKGDKSAFKVIFDMYKIYAYNLIYKILGPTVDHEDLLQEVFFQLYLSLRTFKGKSSFTTWFHRIVIQVCLGNLRYKKADKRKPDGQIVNYEDMQENISDTKNSYEKQYELKNIIEKSLEKLDDLLRIPLVLNIYSEMSIQEIALTLNIPEGTVKSRLFNARNQMKEMFNKQNFE